VAAGGHQDGRRRAEAGDDAGGLLGVGHAVLVFVVVGGAAIGWRGVHQQPAGDARADADGGAALQQVVRVELRDVVGALNVAIAAGADAVVQHQAACERAGDVHADRLPADGGDLADGDESGDRGGDRNAARAVARHVHATRQVQRSVQGALDRYAEGVDALHQQASRGLVDDVAVERRGAGQPNAVAVAALGKGPVEVAVVVAVRGVEVLDHGDGPAVRHRPGAAALHQDADTAVGVAHLDGAFVDDRLVAVER
jgi:hypothetical protein